MSSSLASPRDFALRCQFTLNWIFTVIIVSFGHMYLLTTPTFFFSFVGKNERGPYSSFGGQVSWIRSKSNYWKCFSHLLDIILSLLIQIRKSVVPYSRGSCLQTLPCLLQMPCPHPDWSLAHNSTLHIPTTPGDAPQMEAWVKNTHYLLDLCLISQYWKKKEYHVCFNLFTDPQPKKIRKPPGLPSSVSDLSKIISLANVSH